MKQLTEKQIYEILSKCYPGMSEQVLLPEDAAERAAMIHEDMTDVRFLLTLGETWTVNMPGYQAVHIPSYPLPGISYGPDADPDGSTGA